MRRFNLMLSIFLLLPFLPIAEFNIGLKASDGYPVHNIDTGLNYATIQAAIDAPETLGEHTIQVDAGTYWENVVINKPVSLFGDNKNTTIIDAHGTGVLIRSSNVQLMGFTVQRGSTGICLNSVSNCTVSDNMVKDNGYGILLTHSGSNTLKHNTITGNSYNFALAGRFLSHFVNEVDSSNTANGKPIYYWVNRCDEQIPLDAGYVAVVNSTNITVRDLSLTGNGQGILFAFVNGSTIRNVVATNNYDGIWIADSEDCTVIANDVSHNEHYGMELTRSTDCKVIGNSANKNGYAQSHSGYGIRLVDCHNNSIVGNTAEENYYAIVVQFSENCLISSNNASNNAGMGIWPKFCEKCRIIENFACKNGFYGIEPEDSNDCIISGNNLSSNGLFGMWLLGVIDTCNNLTVTNNHLERNKIGIGIKDSSFNEVYHNNFIENEHHVTVKNSSGNKWNTGSEGNYWSDYVGFDGDNDGVGETEYRIDENNTDNYPLMGMFSSFNTSCHCQVNVITNSTVTDFEYSEINSTIRMHVSNSSLNQSFGFCRVSIPKGLISPPYKVVIDDGLTEVLYFNDTLYDNGTHRWIYFTYEHSIREVNIIPEFPTILMSSLTLMATLLVVLVCKRKYTQVRNLQKREKKE